MLFSYTVSILTLSVKIGLLSSFRVNKLTMSSDFYMLENRMVQTFDFMSKNHKHIRIQKVTFSTKKITLDTALHKKTLYQTHKNLCVHQSHNVVFTYQFPWVHRDRLFCVHTDCVSNLQQSSLDWLNYLVYSWTFLCRHRVFLCQIVWQEVLLIEKVTF